MEHTKQHDNHIWLTFKDEGWAIHSIIDYTTVIEIILWRGCASDFEAVGVYWPKIDWPSYVDRAVLTLESK